MRSSKFILPAIAVLGLLIGCSKVSDRERVFGNVTFDGLPLSSGTITFTPAPGTKGPLVGGHIQEGTYSLDGDRGPLTGTYQVAISHPRPSGKTFTPFAGAEPAAVSNESIPDRYNSKTTLQVVINKGANEHSFDLTSDK